MPFVEAGWPGSNPKDAELFARLRREPLARATLCAFGATRRVDRACADDASLIALVEAATPVCTIFGKSSRFQAVEILGATAEDNLRMIAETVAFLRAAGYRTGLYTSPHLLRYNERVRINGVAVDDTALCAAFARVEQARRGLALTYFEFGTLAAWEAFAAADLDVVILEVGLGGRLDATNIYRPDCAIVTGIDLDHMDYLGPDRESIGREKAGIFRAGIPVSYTHLTLPTSDLV